MSIVYICIGIIIGVFIPGPFDSTLKGWLTSLYRKVFKRESKDKS